ncbi:MAG: sulfatase-like hydrolase/transferase [Planctomycetota bacterium]|nr:MAG: sulfatase-like hydrolase/transferase [Planctomycetota bacterium]
MNNIDTQNILKFLICRLCSISIVACMIGPHILAANKPNIILITTNGQAFNMTGFEGNKIVKTPNLDTLAADSVHFTRCYTPTPQNAPSQACILTGQYPHTHHVTSDGMTLSKTANTFTARLKKANYICGFVGTWNLDKSNTTKPGFGLADYSAIVRLPAGWNNCKAWVQGKDTKVEKFLTDWHGDRAIEFVNQHKEKTFFLWLSFKAPQPPLTYPPATESIYPPDKVDLPKSANIYNRRLPNTIRNLPVVKDYQRKEKNLLQDRSKHYAMITRTDENIGRLVKRLDELKLRDKTAIVFTCNTGLALGEHKLYGQGPLFYDELVRGPLLIHIPKMENQGKKIDRVVSLVDLAPTFCELIDIYVPITMQGQSLMPLIRNPDTSQHVNERFFEYDKQNNRPYPARGIVTSNYKFIDYLKDNDILYDLKRDPEEMNNLNNEREYSAVIKVLKQRLEYWRKFTKDPVSR